MSHPKRYNIIWTVKAEDPEMGVWVEWDDYAALAAEKATDDAEYVQLKQDYLKLRIQNGNLAVENERLKAIIVDECYGSDAYRKHENEAKRLTAENERLRKAGDEMKHWIVSEGYDLLCVDDWNAAKEGRDAK